MSGHPIVTSESVRVPKAQDPSRGAEGMLPQKILEFGVSEMPFPAFEDSFYAF